MRKIFECEGWYENCNNYEIYIYNNYEKLRSFFPFFFGKKNFFFIFLGEFFFWILFSAGWKYSLRF